MKSKERATLTSLSHTEELSYYILYSQILTYKIKLQFDFSLVIISYAVCEETKGEGKEIYRDGHDV